MIAVRRTRTDRIRLLGYYVRKHWLGTTANLQAKMNMNQTLHFERLLIFLVCSGPSLAQSLRCMLPSSSSLKVCVDGYCAFQEAPAKGNSTRDDDKLRRLLCGAAVRRYMGSWNGRASRLMQGVARVDCPPFYHYAPFPSACSGVFLKSQSENHNPYDSIFTRAEHVTTARLSLQAIPDRKIALSSSKRKPKSRKFARCDQQQRGPDGASTGCALVTTWHCADGSAGFERVRVF